MIKKKRWNEERERDLGERDREGRRRTQLAGGVDHDRYTYLFTCEITKKGTMRVVSWLPSFTVHEKSVKRERRVKWGNKIWHETMHMLSLFKYWLFYKFSIISVDFKLEILNSKYKLNIFKFNLKLKNWM